MKKIITFLVFLMLFSSPVIAREIMITYEGCLEASKGEDRDSCFRAAYYVRNVSVCGAVDELELQDKCYYSYALQNRDLEACEKYSDKEKCEKDVVESISSAKTSNILNIALLILLFVLPVGLMIFLVIRIIKNKTQLVFKDFLSERRNKLLISLVFLIIGYIYGFFILSKCYDCSPSVRLGSQISMGLFFAVAFFVASYIILFIINLFNQNGWKNSFKPTPTKIIIFILLFVVLSLVPIKPANLQAPWKSYTVTQYGLPSSFYEVGVSSSIVNKESIDTITRNFNVVPLLLDLLVIYFIIGFGATLFYRIRRKTR